MFFITFPMIHKYFEISMIIFRVFGFLFQIPKYKEKTIEKNVQEKIILVGKIPGIP